MDEFYFFFEGGSETFGPHTSREVRDMVQEGQVPENAYFYRIGDSEWRRLPDYPQLAPTEKSEEALESEATPKKAPVISDEDKEGSKEEEEEIKQRRPTRHQLIRSIRKNLDLLWEAQRESIIARIQDDELDTEFEATRRKHKDVYNEIEEAAVEYWRRSGILKEWIADLTWNDCDLTLRLKKDASEDEKFSQVMEWLEQKEISTLPGVYCFRNRKEYIYVGLGRSLATRIKQHEQKTFFTYATHFRVIIPQNKKHLKKLERLIILNRQPTENDSPGSIRGNPADNCLEFIRGEIKELITDF